MQIALFVLYFIIYPANAYKADLSLNGLFHGGNQETSQIESSLGLKFDTYELKTLANYEGTPDKIFRKYEFSGRYFYDLNNRFNLFSSLILTHDSKKKIDFSRVVVFGAGYKITSWLKYSLGLGDYRKNGTGKFILSHRLKFKKEMGILEFNWINFVYHNLEYSWLKSEAGYRIDLSDYFRFGMLAGVEHDSKPLAEVKSTDWYLKGEFSFSLDL